MTALAGLPLYLEFGYQMGLFRSIDQHVTLRQDGQGWMDRELVMDTIALNLAGGECVDDLGQLEGDDGYRQVKHRIADSTLTRQQRRARERRWRKENRRSVSSPSSMFRFLNGFHDSEQETLRKKHKAFIPRPSAGLVGLRDVNRDLVAALQAREPHSEATLDMDATLVATNKKTALYSYKHFASYQPFNVWWAEQQVMVHTEFRDGNVPAGYQQKRILIEALEGLPEGVTTVRVRADTAGYEHEFLKYMDQGSHERFGKIEFAVGANVTKEFKRAVLEIPEGDWHDILVGKDGNPEPCGRQWAEVCYVPNAIGKKKTGCEYRYLATREALQQQELPGTEEAVQQTLPFQTIKKLGIRYKLHGIATNMKERKGEELVNWLYARCGKSEEAHSVMKEDLAGGQLPSGLFGANAAWWWMMVLALNLNSMFKQLVLGKEWVAKRMKAIRYHIICVAGRVVRHARKTIVRLSRNAPAYELLTAARQKMAMMEPAGAG